MVSLTSLSALPVLNPRVRLKSKSQNRLNKNKWFHVQSPRVQVVRRHNSPMLPDDIKTLAWIVDAINNLDYLNGCAVKTPQTRLKFKRETHAQEINQVQWVVDCELRQRNLGDFTHGDIDDDGILIQSAEQAMQIRHMESEGNMYQSGDLVHMIVQVFPVTYKKEMLEDSPVIRDTYWVATLVSAPGVDLSTLIQKVTEPAGGGAKQLAIDLARQRQAHWTEIVTGELSDGYSIKSGQHDRHGLKQGSTDDAGSCVNLSNLMNPMAIFQKIYYGVREQGGRMRSIRAPGLPVINTQTDWDEYYAQLRTSESEYQTWRNSFAEAKSKIVSGIDTRPVSHQTYFMPHIFFPRIGTSSEGNDRYGFFEAPLTLLYQRMDPPRNDVLRGDFALSQLPMLAKCLLKDWVFYSGTGTGGIVNMDVFLGSTRVPASEKAVFALYYGSQYSAINHIIRPGSYSQWDVGVRATIRAERERNNISPSRAMQEHLAYEGSAFNWLGVIVESNQLQSDATTAMHRIYQLARPDLVSDCRLFMRNFSDSDSGRECLPVGSYSQLCHRVTMDQILELNRHMCMNALNFTAFREIFTVTMSNYFGRKNESWASFAHTVVISIGFGHFQKSVQGKAIPVMLKPNSSGLDAVIMHNLCKMLAMWKVRTVNPNLTNSLFFYPYVQFAWFVYLQYLGGGDLSRVVDATICRDP